MFLLLEKNKHLFVLKQIYHSHSQIENIQTVFRNLEKNGSN